MTPSELRISSRFGLSKCHSALTPFIFENLSGEFTMEGDYNNYIETDPDKRFGKPCVKGTRIAVSDILDMLGEGMNQADILEEHPNLTLIQIKAALAYASNFIDRGAA
jgi:uncharacterized protein (DUF433 family)